MAATLVWFRQDLRLDDNPALAWAARRGEPVIPVFIWDPDSEKPWAPGGASRWWLHHSLGRLRESLRDLGADLILRQGPTLPALEKLVHETGAEAIVWNRRYEPHALANDRRIETVLSKSGRKVQTFNSALLFEPGEILNQKGAPFQVFSPFWKSCQRANEPEEPERGPNRLIFPSSAPRSLPLDRFKLLPRPNWAVGIVEAWRPGEAAALKQIESFFAQKVAGYSTNRDLPAIDGVSRLSPYLHFGEISPRRVWHDGRKLPGKNAKLSADPFLRQLAWREFAYHLLYHFPSTPHEPLRKEFSAFAWKRSAKHLKAWREGRTGYPIVDAGMRQLWQTGWMHNRVRMLVGSFLVKDLRLSWNEGAAWFWDTLVDADLANNTMGWQWIGGCGADAAPYFRVFNPVLQGEKFDPNGGYVRRYLPELASLPTKWIHQPWSAPLTLRRKIDYPPPIVDHQTARDEALEAFKQLRRKALQEAKL